MSVRIFSLTIVFFGLLSCKDFVDVELTNSRVPSSVVFNDDNTAVSAIIGAYHEISSGVVYSGELSSMSNLLGLSGDDLIDYKGIPNVVDFQRNSLTAGNPNVLSLWNSLYKVIYDANAIIEGLEASGKVSDNVKNQIIGEALFMRAFCYFYLVNSFGDVPLVISTDFRVNAVISRTGKSIIYKSIVDDLLAARTLLSDTYVTYERVRPNSFAASSLLAKVYLYMGDWSKAEEYATLVIESGLYEVLDDLDQAFLLSSTEAIWQIAPVDGIMSTNEARSFVVTTEPRYFVLRKNIIDVFDKDDRRLENWIGRFIVGNDTVYYPYKYKELSFATEYSAVLRFPDVYLIRSEARANLEKMNDAIRDVNVIRERAGIELISDIDPAIGKDSILSIIRDERRKEFFAEWGNRWFDLKRLDIAVEVLDGIKDDFSPNDVVYPIPQQERDRNPQLGEQNPGY